MPFQLVLNYRRGDAAGNAGRLHEALAERFGEENVFMDIDTIEPGVDFVEAIEHAVGSCDVFLAMTGQHWLTAADQWGQRRLDHADDFVRLEIEAALRRGIRVIPVLVQDVEMPTADQLADGSEQQQLPLQVRGSVHEPDWSPRNNEVVFSLSTGSGRDIYLYFLDQPGRAPDNLTSGRVAKPTFPAWSDDGARIVFSAEDGIYTMSRNGSALTRLTQGKDLESPSWRPPSR